MEYKPHIDGLRAVAVLGVIFFHLNHELLPGGYIGVDIFFVISGYVITHMIHKQILSGQFSFQEFYTNRFLRLAPALLFILVFFIPFAWQLLPPWPYQDFGQSIVATNFYLSNFLFYIEGGYFDTPGLEKPFFHAWSLSVEEQFYLIFPFFIWFLSKNPRPILGFFFLIFATISLIGYLTVDENKAFYLPWFRFWEFYSNRSRGHAGIVCCPSGKRTVMASPRMPCSHTALNN